MHIGAHRWYSLLSRFFTQNKQNKLNSLNFTALLIISFSHYTHADTHTANCMYVEFAQIVLT